MIVCQPPGKTRAGSRSTIEIFGGRRKQIDVESMIGTLAASARFSSPAYAGPFPSS
jgi:hypothetical protein